MVLKISDKQIVCALMQKNYTYLTDFVFDIKIFEGQSVYFISWKSWRFTTIIFDLSLWKYCIDFLLLLKQAWSDWLWTSVCSHTGATVLPTELQTESSELANFVFFFFYWFFCIVGRKYNLWESYKFAHPDTSSNSIRLQVLLVAIQMFKKLRKLINTPLHEFEL